MQSPEGASDRLPWAALLILAAAGFTTIMTETLPAGLLSEISSGLAVSDQAAGQLVGVYALGNVLFALPAVVVTRRVRRRALLVVALLGFAVASAAMALAPNAAVAFAGRFVGGAFSGLLWGMIPGYARGIVPEIHAGRGLAVASVGTPVALALGTPLGTFVGALVGWRWTFAAMTALGLAVVVAARLVLPPLPGQDQSQPSPIREVLRLPGVRPVLAVVVGWMLSHNLLYTYVAPYLAFVAVPGRPDVVLLTFGVAALAGILLTAVLVDRALRFLVLASIAGFGAAGVALAVAGGTTAVFYASVVLWGVTFGGASTQLNTAVADASETETDIAATLVSTAWNAAIFGGSALGGLLIADIGPQALPCALVVVITPALLIAAMARRHAFPTA